VFYSLLRWCDVLVGNSSAGFYEAPVFGTPVVNVGDRQQGRTMSTNIMSCYPYNDPAVIGDRIELAMKGKRRTDIAHIYGDGHAAERIAKVIGGIKDPRALLRKKFRTCPKLSGGYCSLDEKLEPLRNMPPMDPFTGRFT